jgi:VWFA-related protein
MASAQPVIRVTTRLVDVSVIARDGKGPVADLRQADFKVFDNGVARPIAFFAVNSTLPGVSPAPPLPPNVYSNRAEQRQDGPLRLTVFVIDALNAEFEAQARVRQQFLKYARQLGPRDRASVWVMNDRLRRLQDFTGDPKQLAASVERAKPTVWLTPEINIPGGRPSSASLGAEKAEEMMQYYRMQLTNEMLKDLGEAMARIPGRKNMVWLSAAFPVNMSIGPGGPETNYIRERLNGTGRALARGNVALYPVDVRGIVAPAGGQSVAAIAIAERNRHETMDVIAAATGGRAFYNTNDLGRAMSEAVEDAEVTYTIGFYPAEGDDAELHRVRIDVSRRGVSLRYRDVYASTPAPESSRQDDIHNALVSPLTAAGIPISVRVDPSDPKRPGWLQMTISIPPDGVSGAFDLIFSQRTPDGSQLAMVGEVAGLGGAGPLRRQIQLSPGAARVRVIAYDRESGRAGSVDLPAPRP